MTKPRRDRRAPVPENDLLDEPLIRYGGADAFLCLDDEALDLNSVPDPFTGELPTSESGPLRGSIEVDAESRIRIGRRLQALRTDVGLSRDKLATLAQVPKARVAAAERGDQRVGLSVVSALVGAMGVRLGDLVAPDAPELSMRELTRIGTEAGVPRDLLNRIAERVGRRAYVDALVQGFSWTRDSLLQGSPAGHPLDVPVAFKTMGHESAPSAPVLSLARMLSILIARRNEIDFTGVPDDPKVLRRTVLDATGSVTLDGLLAWAWDAGIVVMPLAKSPDFVAATWFVGDTPVIVLKESRAFGAYWLFDLAHEVGHIALGHVAAEAIVEVEGPEKPDLTDDQERSANDFALELLLPNFAEMVAEVRRRTRNDAARYFKFSVRDVARERRVSAGLLGFVAAQEMADIPRDLDRWGSAQNLAKEEDPEGRLRVEEEFRRRISLEGLSALEVSLLEVAALSG